MAGYRVYLTLLLVALCVTLTMQQRGDRGHERGPPPAPRGGRGPPTPPRGGRGPPARGGDDDGPQRPDEHRGPQGGDGEGHGLPPLADILRSDGRGGDGGRRQGGNRPRDGPYGDKKDKPKGKGHHDRPGPPRPPGPPKCRRHAPHPCEITDNTSGVSITRPCSLNQTCTIGPVTLPHSNWTAHFCTRPCEPPRDHDQDRDRDDDDNDDDAMGDTEDKEMDDKVEGLFGNQCKPDDEGDNEMDDPSTEPADGNTGP